MFITPLDALYITSSIAIIIITIPLSMILWRIYKMMDRAESVLEFIERIISHVKELEKIPMTLIEKFMGK